MRWRNSRVRASLGAPNIRVGAPSSSTCPFSITTTQSATSRANAISCVTTKAGADGQFFLALDIAAFEDVARFKTRVDKIVHEVHASRRAAGVERLFMPGEMEADFDAKYQREGIPLNDRTLADIAAVARERGVAAPADW